MRQSNAHVQMFHLQKILAQIDSGQIGVPEFQRDFDWSDADVRALLVTAFSGWPSGSLLFLDGRSSIFQLRSFEGGPPTMSDPVYAVLDGQQRLTSLYHALNDKGTARYAVKWTIGTDEDLDDAILSISLKDWERKWSTIEGQLQEQVIPVSALRTATDFFQWRDQILEAARPSDRTKLKARLTDLYTYRISRIHDYELPVVILERDTEPAAIARIFERVNRTGLKLGTFDLMVAKTFDPGWNLRDRWLEVQQRFPIIGGFLEDDGMPLLQAMALLQKNDLRQSAVLSLSKKVVQENWDAVAVAANSAVDFLTQQCGVLRKELMPYPNMLAPLIAAARENVLDRHRKVAEQWFWLSGFANQYNAAANTRLASHYKLLKEGRLPRLEPGSITVNLLTANRQGERAVWAAVICYLSKSIQSSAGASGLLASIGADLEVGSLFSKGEMIDSGDDFFEERNALNALLVPKHSVSLSRKLPSAGTERYFEQLQLGPLIDAQIPQGADSAPYRLADARTEAIVGFLRSIGLKARAAEELYGFFDFQAVEGYEEGRTRVP